MNKWKAVQIRNGICTAFIILGAEPAQSAVHHLLHRQRGTEAAEEVTDLLGLYRPA